MFWFIQTRERGVDRRSRRGVVLSLKVDIPCRHRAAIENVEIAQLSLLLVQTPRLEVVTGPWADEKRTNKV